MTLPISALNEKNVCVGYKTSQKFNMIILLYYFFSQHYRSSVLVYWFPYSLLITYIYFSIFYNNFNS